MGYRLVFSDQTIGRDIGEDIFLDELPSDYKVYLLYYAGALPNEALESKLRSLGGIAGKNLLVNIGKFTDPNYDKIVKLFEINKYPVIIMTANASLASLNDDNNNVSSVFVKVDSKHLLGSVDKTIETLECLFTLFLTGKIAEALKEAKGKQKRASISFFARKIVGALKGVIAYFDERDISFSLIEGKFEIKRSVV